MNRRRHQKGLSLVELLVALVLQLLLLAGVVQIFIGQKQTFRTADAFARMQEDGRYAISLLQRDLRATGYAGCRSLSKLQPNIIANNPPAFTQLQDTLRGWDSATQWTSDTGGLGGGSTITLQSNTDIIQVSSVSSSGANLTGNMAAENANIQIDSNPDGLEANDLILISDCENADLFRATNVSQSGGGGSSVITIAHASNANTSNRLSKAYDAGATVLRFSSRTFFIGVSSTDPDQKPTLYMLDTDDTTPQPLVSGVQDFQILYQVDTSGDLAPDISRTANQVTNWENVLGARVGLLVRTDDNTAVETQSITFNGSNANPTNDKRLRYAFWSSVALRNRLP